MALQYATVFLEENHLQYRIYERILNVLDADAAEG